MMLSVQLYDESVKGKTNAIKLFVLNICAVVVGKIKLV